VPIVLKSGSLNLLEPSGPVQACSGIAIPFCFIIVPQSDNYEEIKRQQQEAPPHFAFLFVHPSTDLFLVGGLVVEDQQKGVCVIYFFMAGEGGRWVGSAEQEVYR
jgi:hypothetical protein